MGHGFCALNLKPKITFFKILIRDIFLSSALFSEEKNAMVSSKRYYFENPTFCENSRIKKMYILFGYDFHKIVNFISNWKTFWNTLLVSNFLKTLKNILSKEFIKKECLVKYYVFEIDHKILVYFYSMCGSLHFTSLFRAPPVAQR